jgi:hypothetical protein
MKAVRAILLLNMGIVAADWPRFRGPNGSGLAEASNLPPEIGPGKFVLWRVEMPKGFSSPVVSQRSVFLTGYEGAKLFTMAVDRNTGAIQWKTDAPKPLAGKPKWKTPRPHATHGFSSPVIYRPAKGTPEVVVSGVYQLDALRARHRQETVVGHRHVVAGQVRAGDRSRHGVRALVDGVAHGTGHKEIKTS